MVRARLLTSPRARQRATAVAVLSAMALVVLDAGMANLAVPAVAASFAAPAAGAILIVSAYQMALLAGLLPAAHLAERFGSRRMFVAGLGLFSGGSVLAAAAPSLELLVAARVVQGLGGAAIMALGVALLRVAFGQERLGEAIGWNALIVALCSAAAPLAGALILSGASWPWLLLAKLPVAALALAACAGLPHVERTRCSLDLRSVAFHVAAAALFLAAAQQMPARPAVAAATGAAAAFFAILLAGRGGGAEAPFLPTDLLARRPFRIAALASVCCFVGQSVGLLALPLHLQLALGRGVGVAGLVLACWPVSVAATSIVATRLAAHRSGSSLCAAGASALAAGLLLSALGTFGTSIWPLALGAAVSGIGFGLFQVPNNRILFLSVPPRRSAAAGGVQGSARLAGQTLGAMAMGLLLSLLPASSAPRFGLLFGALFAVAAALVSLSGLSRWRPKDDPRRGPDAAGQRTPTALRTSTIVASARSAAASAELLSIASSAASSSRSSRKRFWIGSRPATTASATPVLSAP